MCLLLGGRGEVIYPAMDLHLVQGGVAVVLGILDVKETGISSVRLGLWLVYAFTLPLKYIKGYGREICHLPAFQRDFMAVKKSRKFSGFAIYYYCKDSAFTAVKTDAKL